MRIASYCLAAAGLLALAACDQPKPRPPGPPPAAKAPEAGAPAAPAAAPPARVIPSDTGPTPPPPTWATLVIGKTLRDAYPQTGSCKGNTDIVQKTYAGDPPGVQIHGWGWDLKAKARVQRVVLVDRDSKIVGAGESGVPRPDVNQYNADIKDPNTGWNADLPRTTGYVDGYGVLDAKTVCPLGHIEF
jgi:hypothetical protein